MSLAGGHTAEVAAAIGFALFVWWFSTGAILWLATRPGRWPEIATIATAPLCALAALGLARSTSDASVAGAFEAFSTAILIWGWFELAFLAGMVLGPDRAPCPPGLSPGARFRAAWRALAHHELALAGALALIAAASWDTANPVGLWTFATLFCARISAKLNVFLGVPNLTEEFLPKAVTHLKSFFVKRPMNGLFPVSVTALTLATGGWAALAAFSPEVGVLRAGGVLVATLSALALIEHWLMVLPLRDAALWTWMMPRQAEPPAPAPGRSG